MHMLYEMLAVAPCPTCFLHVPHCHAIVLWEPGCRDHPTFYRMSRSRHFSFCTGISMSYRNRNVAVAPFPLSLSWHPFCFCHDDKCLFMLMSTFNKNCTNLFMSFAS
ncbi:hypothetical protein VPH35_064796 [Triticum aestivum]